MRKIFGFIGEYKKYTILAPLCVIIETTITLLIPFIISKIIDNGIIANNGLNYITKMGCIAILLVFVALFFSVLGGIFTSKASRGFAKNLRQAIFDKIQSFSFYNIDKFSTASLITRITSDVVKVQNTFMLLIRMAVRCSFRIIGATMMAILINPKLSVIFIITALLLFVILITIATIAFPRFTELLKKEDEMNLTMQENLINIRIVKSLVREDYEKEKFNKRARNLKKAQVYAEKLLSLNTPVENFIIYISILAILWFGGNMIIKGGMKIGELSSFLTYTFQILFTIMMFAFLFVMLMFSKASVNRILEVLEEEPDIIDGEKDTKFKDGSIEFKNVSFSYSKNKENLTLKNVNLKINSGEIIGIISSTGAGKSTLINLLSRLYNITDGVLEIGGNNIKDYKLKTLRSQISIVLQKNTLFSGTIKENLLWGDKDASDEEIIEVCKKAQAHDFIMSFPKGYDTYLEQGAVNISGGQKQRLCIARALLKKPKILILDDSTSAVDTTTETKIRKVFKEEMPNITKIIIAQRISSIEDADKIIVLDNGTINAIGKHNELIVSNDIYKSIYQLQKDGIMEE